MASRVAAKHMDIPYMDGSVEAEFNLWNATEARTTLGVLAALKSMTIPGDIKHLHFGYLLLQEILRRSGYPGLHLCQDPDNLHLITIWLLCAGRAAREELRYSDPDQIFDLVRNTRSTVLLYKESLLICSAIQFRNCSSRV
jgi:hypothetical protein